MATRTGTAVKQVPLSQVRVGGGFWGKLMVKNRRVTIPHVHDQCKTTGAIDVWKLKMKGERRPGKAWDSDVAKYVEAVGHSLTHHPDKALEKRTDKLIATMAKAQRKDGYLNSHYLTLYPKRRWTDVKSAHELYCAGHLIEAGVAYFSGTGKRALLDIVCRYADHIAETFGPGKGQIGGYPGHEEIELALVKLYRATGTKRYLDLARYFIDERGKKPFFFEKEAKARGEDIKKHRHGSPEYSQSHLPVRRQKKAVGHAVRAMYLYAAMTDVAVETGDASLMKACDALWENVTLKRMHITGGVGANSRNEGFSTDYDLPSEGAYLETCGAVGLALWGHRMFLAKADGRYIDVMERALYNGVLSALAYDGRHFFYGNPIAVHPGFDRRGPFVKDGYNVHRFSWSAPPCCPTNLVRIIAQFPHFIYAQRGDTVFVNLYAQSRAEVEVAGLRVGIDQKTEYPWDGRATFGVSGDGRSEWTLALRIPGWCRKASITVGGRKIDPASISRNGYAFITRVWKKSGKVELVLPMPVCRMGAHPMARHTTGRVALERGPVVYCLEQVDNGPDLNDIELPSSARLTVRRDPKLFGGVSVITGAATRSKDRGWQGALYRTDTPGRRAVTIKAIPFHLWANRKLGGMIVWIREA